jgi:glycosyltransferase involved in cell wall biosynthesis
MQEYSNYHIVFIDDASTDGTGDQIEALLAKQKIVPKSRYVIIKNK